MGKRVLTPRQSAAEYSDEQLALAAEGSGLTVSELRELLAKHPLSPNEVARAEQFAERVRLGTEKLTYRKL